MEHSVAELWLAAVYNILAFHMSRSQPGRAQACGAVIGWLEQVIQTLQCQRQGNKDRTDRWIARLQQAIRSIKELSKQQDASRAVKQLEGKSGQHLHSIITQNVKAKSPLLGRISPSNSSNKAVSSPFRTSANLQLDDSDAWPNQQEAFGALQRHFRAVNSKRPSQQELQRAAYATYSAFCELRMEVCNVLLAITVSSGAGNRQQRQQQVGKMLQEFQAAWTAEQQLLGVDSSWHNIGAGWIEPAGTGKTGIMNLVPYAVLSNDAPPDIPAKILIVGWAR